MKQGRQLTPPHTPPPQPELHASTHSLFVQREPAQRYTLITARIRACMLGYARARRHQMLVLRRESAAQPGGCSRSKLRRLGEGDPQCGIMGKGVCLSVSNTHRTITELSRGGTLRNVNAVLLSKPRSSQLEKKGGTSHNNSI